MLFFGGNAKRPEEFSQKRYAHDLFTNKMSLRLLSTHPCCTFGSIRLFALNNLVLNFLDIQMICCKIRKTAPGADILKTPKDVLQRMMTAIGERRGEGATVRETSQKEEVELWVGFPYVILKYTYTPAQNVLDEAQTHVLLGLFGAIAPRVPCFPSSDWRPGWRSRVWKSQIIPYSRLVSNSFCFLPLPEKIIQFDILLLFNWGGEKPSTRILKIYPP